MIDNKSNFMNIIRKIFSIIFYFSGWKIKGNFPNISKFIAIVVPHTSLIDFWHMLNARILLDLSHYSKGKKIIQRNIYWLAKKSLFRWPIQKFIERLGAIPIDRSKSHNVVDKLVKMALTNTTFVIGIAPDGKRLSHKTKTFNLNWKTGFYYLAIKANLPIVVCCINHTKKTLFISNTFYLKNHFDNDMRIILNYYKNCSNH